MGRVAAKPTSLIVARMMRKLVATTAPSRGVLPALTTYSEMRLRVGDAGVRPRLSGPGSVGV
jgi:hypothetical protein